MSTVSKPLSTVTGPRNLPESLAAALACAAKVADKESARDSLTDGHTYKVEVSIVGSVDGEAVDQRIDAILSVGHETTKSSSSTPNPAQLIGHILSQLNRQTRDKIIRELPAAYEANGCELPAVDGAIADATEAMLSRLRAKKSVVARGAVSAKYKLEDSRANRLAVAVVDPAAVTTEDLF